MRWRGGERRQGNERDARDDAHERQLAAFDLLAPGVERIEIAATLVEATGAAHELEPDPPAGSRRAMPSIVLGCG